MADSIIDCQGLTKSFGTFDALIDCDLQVKAQTIVGLLGPNGAGKTTLLRTLLGFQRPTRGTARVCGHDCVTESLRVREHVAYLPGEARLFRSMSGEGVLRIFSGLSLYGDYARSRQVAQRLDLDLQRRVMFMSTGMRQKLALSIVLGSQAPLVILDEPTANLDPNVRREVIGMVSEIRQAGRTVVMSSHIFSDIEDTCDEVIILRQGRLVHRQSIVGLAALHMVQGTWCGAPRDFSTLTAASEWVVESQLNGDVVELQLRGSAERWMSWLAELPLANVTVQRASVGSIYHRYHGA